MLLFVLISLCNLQVHLRRFFHSKAVAVFICRNLSGECDLQVKALAFVAAVIPGLPDNRSTLTEPIKCTLLVLQYNMALSSCVGGLHV